MDKQQLSAFLDGEWPDGKGTVPWEGPDGASERCDDWQCWHVIGDAMRQSRCLDVDVADRVRQRLAEDAPVAAPPVSGRQVRRSHRYAGWAVVASLLLAGIIGWSPLDADGPETGNIPLKVADSGPAAVMPVARPLASAGDANPYIAAHHELAFESGIQTVAMATEGKP